MTDSPPKYDSEPPPPVLENMMSMYTEARARVRAQYNTRHDRALVQFQATKADIERDEQHALQVFDTQMMNSFTAVVTPRTWLEWLGWK
jgi:hypothetical protein